VGFKSQSIIKYIEPMTGDLCTARFADSILIRIISGIKGENCTINLNAWKMIGMQEACPLECEKRV
jgi:hypothetical protein